VARIILIVAMGLVLFVSKKCTKLIHILFLKLTCVPFVQRNYDVSLPHNKIPEELCRLAKKLAEPAMPAGEVFRPEAAIVNYFALGIKIFILHIPPFICLLHLYSFPSVDKWTFR